MATMTKLGPADDGRALTLEEFEFAEYERGFRYELIDGRLYVSPPPDPPENILEQWVMVLLLQYRMNHPEVMNYVTTKARVFIPDRPDVTCPEPDVAAYADFPLEGPYENVRWQDVSPLLVAEVMTGSHWKDLRRNTELYLMVPSIREYWVIDGRTNSNQPTLIQHRRRGGRWVVRRFPFDSTFTTKLLPGFRLLVDPRQAP